MTGIVFFVCFITGCCLALIRHPIFGLLTYVATYYLHPPSRWWGVTLPSIRWSLVAGCITLIAILVQKRKTDPKVVKERRGFLIGYMCFIAWLIIQSTWVMNPIEHNELIWINIKYIALIWVITSAIDSEKHLLWFCWSHVAGCAYLGWIAYTNHQGGRFEDFGGPDISEANAGALQLVSGLFIGSCLLLFPKLKHKVSALFSLPLIANAIILTGSRSAFLSGAIGGLFFNHAAPIRIRRLVRVLSLVATVAFIILANDNYWTRIGTIKAGGQQIQGVDTGGGRLEIMQAQFKMFTEHPLGCGHRCTATLSPMYMDDKLLTGKSSERQRSSHNTFFTLLVEQGVPGVLFYASFLIWIISKIAKLRANSKLSEEAITLLAPGIIAFMISICIGDMFIDYLKSEVRIWFIALMIAITIQTKLQPVRNTKVRK